MLNRRQFAGGLAASWCGAMTQKTAFAISAPQPSAETQESMQRLQQNFVDLRFGMYIHLNMATYEEREWGDPKASPAIFNPRHLDTDQWARAALSAGMSYGCLTTKHHDGFCLWPTATSSPSVKQTAFREDIVRAYVDSFRRHGLKVCLYFSILDLRANIRPYVITPQKIAMIKDQLTELLTHYGEITALVIDGWYAAWSRISYEQLPFLDIYSHVKALQPNCLVSDYNVGRFPAPALYYSDIKQYEQHAGQTIPAHSIIPSQSANTLQSVWFWKESFPTEALRPAAQVVNQWLIPFNQRHCNLILNVAPNRDGRFDENAVDRLA
ncbi:MAG: alpha-L-fucosidase, partial [Acidobacteriaceae bacterium]